MNISLPGCSASNSSFTSLSYGTPSANCLASHALNAGRTRVSEAFPGLRPKRASSHTFACAVANRGSASSASISFARFFASLSARNFVASSWVGIVPTRSM